MSFFLLLLTLHSAHAGKRDKVETAPSPPEAPVLQQQISSVTLTSGSLWSEVKARQMMGLDGSARQVGDLITVQIIESASTSLDATTRTKKSNKNDASVGSAFGLANRAFNANPGLNGQLTLQTGSSGAYDGSGTTDRNSSVKTILTCEVLEVLPNGNLHLWGWKQVRVNREVQYIVLDGVARPRDIRLDNTIASTLLAQAKIEVTGSGVVADRQGPGLGTRIIDFLWPF